MNLIDPSVMGLDIDKPIPSVKESSGKSSEPSIVEQKIKKGPPPPEALDNVTIEDDKNPNIENSEEDSDFSEDVTPPGQAPEVPSDPDEPIVTGATEEKPQSDARDYSIFDPADAPFLKKVPNGVFNHLKNRLPELYAAAKRVQELENSQKEASQFFGHPNGYLLHPDFEKQQVEFTKANFETQFWHEQLKAIKAGQVYWKLDGYDEKGEPKFSGPFNADGADDINMLGLYNQAVQKKASAEVALKNIQEGHKKFYDDQLGVVNREAEKYFAWRKNEKILDDTRIFGGTTTPKALRKQFLDTLPPAFKSFIPSDLGADLFLTANLMAKRIKELEAQVQSKKIENQTLQKVQPSVSSARTSKASKNSTLINLEEIDKDL